MEKIIITGLKVPALIGVYDWERTGKTVLLFDIEIDADLKKAMHSDNVADTIDYGKLAEFIQQAAKETQYELLEALGGYIIQAVFERFAVEGIRLSITKPDILPDAEAVTVVFQATNPQ